MSGYSTQFSFLMLVLCKEVLIFHTGSCGSFDVEKGKFHGANQSVLCSQFWLGSLG